MDRSKVRIGLITTGIITGLTLILYLPVLIWSPPWGEDGLYTYKAADHQSRLEYYYYVNGDLMHHYIIESDDLKTISLPITEQRKHITSKELYLYRGDWERNKVNFKRLQNPFTLWYIKWLEWTN